MKWGEGASQSSVVIVVGPAFRVGIRIVFVVVFMVVVVVMVAVMVGTTGNHAATC